MSLKILCIPLLFVVWDVTELQRREVKNLTDLLYAEASFWDVVGGFPHSLWAVQLLYIFYFNFFFSVYVCVCITEPAHGGQRTAVESQSLLVPCGSQD